MRDGDQFSRQRVLSQVGDLGQARIESTHLRLPPEISREGRSMAEVYAHAAGLLLPVVPSEPSPQIGALQKTFRHPASRDIGVGSAYALASVHQALREK